MKIGFIGLGKMGGNMVKRLLRGGHEVAIWNRSREKTDEIAKIEEQQNGILKRKYLYSTNFAVNNGDYEVSPYVALADIYDINLKY